MDISQMKDYVSRYYSIYSTGNINEFSELCADPEREINAYSFYVQAFSDLKLTATNIIAEGNQVVTEWEVTGIHINEFIGKLPTNKEIRMTGVDIFQFKENKITNHKAYINWLEVAKQLNLERFDEIPY